MVNYTDGRIIDANFEHEVTFICTLEPDPRHEVFQSVSILQQQILFEAPQIILRSIQVIDE